MGQKLKARDMKPEAPRFQARAVEVVFDGHLNGDEILLHYKKTIRYGLYKGFVKWHNGNEDDDEDVAAHTHVALILREKPKIDYKKLRSFFKVGEVEPKLVNPMGKGNSSPLTKLGVYVSYLTDGHDNGLYEDTWNYKYDHELDLCKNDGKILCLLGRGLTLKQIINQGDWNFRAYCMKHKDCIDKMVNNWRKFNHDDTVYHHMDEFKGAVQKEFEKWNTRKETLVLKGPSNMGKTELAKAALNLLTGKPALFCRNLNKLKFRDAGQAFILDDMNFHNIGRTKMIALTDIENESDIRVLFGMHTIDAGTPRIFTTNEEYEDYFPLDTTEAVKRRVRWLDLTKYGRLY